MTTTDDYEAGYNVNPNTHSLTVSNTIAHLVDDDAYFGDAYFSEDIPDYVSITVPYAVLLEWRDVIANINNCYLSLTTRAAPLLSNNIEVRLPTPPLTYWEKREDEDGVVSAVITLHNPDLNCSEKVYVSPNQSSNFDTVLSLRGSGEVVIYGAENTIVAWSFSLGDIECLINTLQEGLERFDCPNCGSNNISAGKLDSCDDKLMQVVTCGDCDHEWGETFKFSMATTPEGELEQEPQACPSCDSEHIEVCSTEAHGNGLATRSCVCNGCNTDWTEEFLFSGRDAA